MANDKQKDSKSQKDSKATKSNTKKNAGKALRSGAAIAAALLAVVPELATARTHGSAHPGAARDRAAIDDGSAPGAHRQGA